MGCGPVTTSVRRTGTSEKRWRLGVPWGVKGVKEQGLYPCWVPVGPSGVPTFPHVTLLVKVGHLCRDWGLKEMTAAVVDSEALADGKETGYALSRSFSGPGCGVSGGSPSRHCN